MTIGSEYTCAVCGNTYTRIITDEESITIRDQEFPGGEEVWGEFELVCDDCYKKVMGVTQN